MHCTHASMCAHGAHFDTRFVRSVFCDAHVAAENLFDLFFRCGEKTLRGYFFNQKRHGCKAMPFSINSFSYFLLVFFAAAATREDRATRAMALGMTISWLNMSASSQTRSLDRQEPRKMKTRASTE